MPAASIASLTPASFWLHIRIGLDPRAQLRLHVRDACASMSAHRQTALQPFPLKVANLAVFLASDEAPFITATEVTIDAAYTTR